MAYIINIKVWDRTPSLPVNSQHKVLYDIKYIFSYSSYIVRLSLSVLYMSKVVDIVRIFCGFNSWHNYAAIIP